MVTSVACATRREKHLTRNGLWSQDHSKHINFKLAQFTCKIPYVASQKIPAAQHLITNLAYKLKPHHNRTQYLGARLDTCADITTMPASVYQLIFDDRDCKKLASSSKLEIGTSTTDNISYWILYFVCHTSRYPVFEGSDIPCYIHEGSVVLSCVTTLELSLIQPCNNLDYIPSSASLISSKADHPRKKSQKNMQVSKPCHKACSSKEQSPAVLTSHYHNVNQCVIYEDQDETSKWECTAHYISMCDDKNCESTKCVHMQPVKPATIK